ncbi:hypothetical protein KY385_03025 [Candidatus Parcubacteria bacterium]|nr:hypothetical protein [Candidatus Parcubacteria bacterium]
MKLPEVLKPKYAKEEQPVERSVGRALIAAEERVYDRVGERIRAGKTAMAERFSVQEEDFSVVVSETERERKAVLVYSAPNGLRRSWVDIFDPKKTEKYVVEVDGERHDTRTAMTWEVYKGMVLGLDEGQHIDASGESAKTDTWLTGESIARIGAGGEMAHMASNDSGTNPEFLSGYTTIGRENETEYRTFRPGIVVYSEQLMPAAA